MASSTLLPMDHLLCVWGIPDHTQKAARTGLAHKNASSIINSTTMHQYPPDSTYQPLPQLWYLSSHPTPCVVSTNFHKSQAFSSPVLSMWLLSFPGPLHHPKYPQGACPHLPPSTDPSQGTPAHTHQVTPSPATIYQPAAPWASGPMVTKILLHHSQLKA